MYMYVVMAVHVKLIVWFYFVDWSQFATTGTVGSTVSSNVEMDVSSDTEMVVSSNTETVGLFIMI